MVDCQTRNLLGVLGSTSVGCQNQNQNSLLVKRQTDNTTPGCVVTVVCPCARHIITHVLLNTQEVVATPRHN